MSLVILLVSWSACGVLAYGITLAYFQRQWPTIAYSTRIGDVVLAGAMALGGPCGLFVAFLMGGAARHGLLFWPDSTPFDWNDYYKEHGL